MNKRTYIMVIAGIVLVFLVDLIFPDHHHAHFAYHTWPGFDIAFGLLGAFFLMIFSLGLGDIFLWRTTCSVLLEPEMAGFGNDSARVKRWFVTDGDKVKSGQPLVEFETDRGVRFTIDAPYDGKVSKCFIDAMSYAQVGESVVDLTVGKHAMGHGNEEGNHA